MATMQDVKNYMVEIGHYAPWEIDAEYDGQKDDLHSIAQEIELAAHEVYRSFGHRDMNLLHKDCFYASTECRLDMLTDWLAMRS